MGHCSPVQSCVADCAPLQMSGGLHTFTDAWQIAHLYRCLVDYTFTDVWQITHLYSCLADYTPLQMSGGSSLCRCLANNTPAHTCMAAYTPVQVSSRSHTCTGIWLIIHIYTGVWQIASLCRCLALWQMTPVKKCLADHCTVGWCDRELWETSAGNTAQGIVGDISWEHSTGNCGRHQLSGRSLHSGMV